MARVISAGLVRLTMRFKRRSSSLGQLYGAQAAIVASRDAKQNSLLSPAAVSCFMRLKYLFQIDQTATEL